MEKAADKQEKETKDWGLNTTKDHADRNCRGEEEGMKEERMGLGSVEDVLSFFWCFLSNEAVN